MDLNIQRIGIWGGIAMMALLGFLFVVVMGLIPPPSPTWSAVETARFLTENKVPIRIGAVMMAMGTIVAYPWVATICVRIRYVEGKWGVLSIIQVMAAAVLVPSVVYPLLILAVATFRPETRSPELTEALSDLFWITFVCPAAFIVTQALVLAVATFIDTGGRPGFPRWFGYLNIWYAILAVPGAAAMAFNEGPLAWNGLFAFWIPLSAISIWIIGIQIVMTDAIKKEQALATTAVPT